MPDPIAFLRSVQFQTQSLVQMVHGGVRTSDSKLIHARYLCGKSLNSDCHPGCQAVYVLLRLKSSPQPVGLSVPEVSQTCS